MTDLVERLRHRHIQDCKDAADRIEALEKEVEKWRSGVESQSDLIEKDGEEIETLRSQLAEKDKEIAELRHDLERYMGIANAECNERDALVREMDGLRDCLQDCVSFLCGDISGSMQRKGIIKESRAALGGEE